MPTNPSTADLPRIEVPQVLVSTSPALPGEGELPPPTDEFGRFVSTVVVDL